MVSLLSPGYNPPTHVQIGGDLLDTVYTTERDKCATILEGNTVCQFGRSLSAKAATAKCEHEFKCLVHSIVTDHTGNVRKMHSDLEENEALNVITYSCSVPNVKEHVVKIVKYFRDNHFEHAKYKQEGGQQLVLPQDVRWNTMAECLSAYNKY
ncbi:hypothetical protein PR048_014360 [Dryococelus australis]|uniref:Uncharacterized protein n=1 Tax=Dryococelus australis TaxID=614101 RepID=A0ABQ9HE71_9NEOP|nr:hypothetical protein PR048_014360 [Dryococelus australis]